MTFALLYGALLEELPDPLPDGHPGGGALLPLDLPGELGDVHRPPEGEGVEDDPRDLVPGLGGFLEVAADAEEALDEPQGLPVEGCADPQVPHQLGELRVLPTLREDRLQVVEAAHHPLQLLVEGLQVVLGP